MSDFPVTPPRPLPKYVFVLSLENRSFDHLFGRSDIHGKDAKSRSSGKSVNGVLDASGKNIDKKYTNSCDGKTYGIPNADAPSIMPSDPKHEFEHILCQACGPDACKALMQELFAGPASYGVNKPPASFYNTVPPPPQSQPLWVRFGEKTTPGQGRALRPPSVSARPAPNNAGFVHSYVRSFSANQYEKGDAVPQTTFWSDDAQRNDPQLVMGCFDTKKQLPVLHSLASKFVICDNFFSSLPGPTGPNRFFMMAGSSAGYDGGPASSEMTSWSLTGHLPVTNGNIFTKLQEANVPFQIFGDDNFPMAGVMEGVHATNTFRVHDSAKMMTLEWWLRKATDQKPFPFNFVWIEPDYDVASSLIPGFKHPMYSTGNSMHPCSDVRKAEQLIAHVYNWISGNKSVWEHCVLFITWDEHGGFYDHVLPPSARAPGDTPSIGRTWSFEFNQLGTRVPCLVISPLIESNLIDSRQYDHCSILKTVIDLNNARAFTDTVPFTKMQPWTDRISDAASMLGLFTQEAAKARTVTLDTPPAPAALAANLPDDAKPSQEKPSGNTVIFLASAMNLHRSADPSVDMSATVASLTTDDAASKYFDKAAKAIAASHEQQNNIA